VAKTSSYHAHPKGMYAECKQTLMLSAGRVWGGTSTFFIYLP